MIKDEVKLDVPKYGEIINNIIIIFILYIYLFQPPIFNKSIYIVLEFTIYVFYALSNGKVFFEFINKFRFEFLLILLIVFFSIIRDLFTGEIVYADRMAAWGFQSFLFAYFIIFVVNKRNSKRIRQISLFNSFYWTSFIAAIFTFALLTNSSFDNFYKSISVDDYYELLAHYDERFRAYGIAENLLFTYPYVLGLFAGYSLLVIKKNILLVIPIFLFLLGIYFNARVGFVAFVLFLLYLIFVRRAWKSLILILILGSLVLVLVSHFMPELTKLVIGNQEWVTGAFYQMSDFLFGTHYYNTGTNTMTVLTQNFIIFPDSFAHWIWGDGISLFLGTSRGNSDVGYILELNYGGILFLSMLLILMYYTSNRLRRLFGWKFWYTFFFVLSIILLNFKGFFFAATPGGRILFFYMCIL